MSLYIGIDIGVTSVKVAGRITKDNRVAKDFISGLKNILWLDDEIFCFPAQRISGNPLKITKSIIEQIDSNLITSISVTGSSGKLIADALNAAEENEFTSISKTTARFYPHVRTIFEMGGETSKFISLEYSNNDVGIIDYGINGDCAAGTGSFIDQQANRLHYRVEDIGDIVLTAKKAARIAGRCSVFAKSDMIHAQQKGYTPPEILRGLCIAVARNFKATIVKGKPFKTPALFVGGLSLNKGVANAMLEAFELSEGGLIVPKFGQFFGAMGCAIIASEKTQTVCHKNEQRTTGNGQHAQAWSTVAPLTKDNVSFLRETETIYPTPQGTVTDTYLGIDIGSVSTNLVIIDTAGHVLKSIYTMTRARPIEVVSEGLKEIEAELGDKINILGVGTTGSGRELIGELVNADTITDEITCHKTGATHVAKTLTDGTVDTIFEIGGQDSKFIRLKNGVVIDFAMNEACAAGTGSFLEEQAEKLGIKIKGEFAEYALKSKAPINMGERCTVFMERDINTYQSKGASIEDITAGLAYSVVYNYLNRVVRGRSIGDHIYFQGGTAYNDSVACAFARVLGKKITVPPHNGVVGAIGAALIAKRYIELRKSTHSTPRPSGRDTLRVDAEQRPAGSDLARVEASKTAFRGYNLSDTKYSIREFTCPACSNQCDIQEFTVNAEKTYWGDKCSERYRKRSKTTNTSTIENLVKVRSEALLKGYEPEKKIANAPTIGIPMCMYTYDRLPFWMAYFKALGANVVLSPESNKKIVQMGLSSTVAEPCYPIKVAHGHIKYLLDEKTDYVWVPNILNVEPSFNDKRIPYLCPWGMTLPFVVKASPTFENDTNRLLAPTIQFFYGKKFAAKCLKATAKTLGATAKQNKKAVDLAYAAQTTFNVALKIAGRKALNQLKKTGEPGVILIGRPYNLFDMGINLSIPTKLREQYGVNTIPLEFLPFDDIEIKDIADNMFWSYGRKILAAIKLTAQNPNLHIIYITNFKCGPDSFIKHYSVDAAGKPFLILQMDEHANDAGIITRIEAYLESKGIMNKETKTKNQEAERASV